MSKDVDFCHSWEIPLTNMIDTAKAASKKSVIKQLKQQNKYEIKLWKILKKIVKPKSVSNENSKNV